jgi:xanthine dehydrogenase accessory factor
VDEALFATLGIWLRRRAVVLASVIETRGATPRKRGSRMLVSARAQWGSVGGGEAEARVRELARALLQPRRGRTVDLALDLAGGPEAAGVCGGRMRFALRRWQGPRDCARAMALAARLAAGASVELTDEDLGAHGAAMRARPNPRLLIVGAGHCGAALYELASRLDFECWVADSRPAALAHPVFADAVRLHSDELARALDTAREIYVVLLNRDYGADIAALEQLLPRRLRFVGMMGSRRRIATVRAALPQHAQALARIVAPVGIEIEAETPHEIAVSILAQLVRERRATKRTGIESAAP